MRRKQKKHHLKVIPGKGTDQKSITELTRRPLHIILLFLALFLLAQILVGWVWGAISRSSIKTELVTEGSFEQKISISGLITFREHMVLAPASGFVYYNVETGERVPAGKIIAGISEFPLSERTTSEVEEEDEAFFHQFKNWLFHGEQDEGEDYAHLFPGRETVDLSSAYPGVVNLIIDGWEEFGPDSRFAYLTEEEFNDKTEEPRIMNCGKQVYRSMPIMRIIDNYSWYYSAILPPEFGEGIVEKEKTTLYFEFEPDMPVDIRMVEANQGSDGNYEITWRVDRKISDYISQRWVEAEIVYKTMKGILLPRDAFWEDEENTGVFVVDHGRIKFVEINVVAENEEHFLVEGLSPNQRVVINPSRVRDGQRFYH